MAGEPIGTWEQEAIPDQDQVLIRAPSAPLPLLQLLPYVVPLCPRSAPVVHHLLFAQTVRLGPLEEAELDRGHLGHQGVLFTLRLTKRLQIKGT